MTDDKAETKDAQGETIEIGVLTDPVEEMDCPGCGVKIDTRGIASFTEIACPQCKTRQTVPAKLGNFRLLNVLGAGGMGAVFLAQDDTLKRRVAVKVMLGSIGEDPEVLAVFRKEAQSAARLNHPNIVQIYSFGQEKGQPYLVMELVSGDKLDDLIDSGVPLDPAFVLRVGMEIAEGLAAAQKANLVHGDIKPGNVLFDEQMRAKLVDFGIASMLSSKDAGDEVWGTPFYIAPEKAQRRKADVRSDIYSLGATLYHAIAGKPPFDGEDAVAVIRARFESPATPLVELRPGIDPQAVAIVERMMQNDLFLRYPNYTSLLNDMAKYLDSVPPQRKAGPPGRRRRFRATQGGAAPSGLLNGSAPVAAGAPSGALKAAGTPAPSTNGRKAFVIQRGTIAAAPVAAASTAPTPALSPAPSAGPSTGPLPPIQLRRGLSPKTVAIVVISLFVLVILAGLGVLLGVAMSSRGKEKAMDALFVAAQTFENDLPTLDAAVAEAVKRLAERDAEAQKVIASAGDIVQKALSVQLVVPDLEPPKQVPAPEPAVGEDAPQPAEAPAVPPVPGAPAAPDAPPAAEAPAVPEVPPAAPVAEPPAAEAPAPEPAAPDVAAPAADAVVAQPDDRPALVVKADALFVPARAIRAKLRQAEALRDQTFDPLSTLKRETMDQAQWQARKDRADGRRKAAETIDGLAKECDALLVEMRRMVPGLEREAAGLLEAARRQAEADRLAREAAAAEEAKRRAEEAARARIDEDVAYFNGVLERNRDAVGKYDYARVARELERVRTDLGTDEGKAKLDAQVELYKRLESLKQFIVKDLHDNKGLRWGLGAGDVTDADETAVYGVGNRKVPLFELTIPQWLNFITRLLENRPPERDIRVIEHGEQLFNSAIFCIVHGGGAETAEAKALTLLKLALKRRTALRADVPRFLPSLADKELDD